MSKRAASSVKVKGAVAERGDDAGFVAAARRGLSQLAPLSVWRNLAAGIAALAAFGAVNGGLFYFARPLQTGVFAGLITGLVASGMTSAVVTAVLAAGVGLLIMPAPPLPFEALGTLDLMLAPVAAGLAAAALRLLCSRWRFTAPVALWLAFALVVVNLWATTLYWDSRSLDDPTVVDPFPSLFTQLKGADVGAKDDAFSYLSTYHRMRDGVPYHEAFLASHREWDYGRAPAEVWGFRQPVLFWMWQAIPGDGAGLVYGLLGLSTLALLGAMQLGRTAVKAPLVLPAIAAIATQFLHSTTDRMVVYAEVWAVCFVLMAIGAYVRADSSKRPRAWIVTAVSLATVAALIRELAAPLLLAGFVAAVLFRRKRFDVFAWGAGIVVFGAAWAAHALAVQDVLTHGASSLIPGGVRNVMDGLTYGGRFFGGSAWFPVVLSLLGLAALAVVPKASLRTLVALPCLMLMASWMLYSNNASSVLAGGPTGNYWGKLVEPVLYAAAPALFALLPGMARGPAAGTSR